MDFSKFKVSDWLKVGGGLGFLIFGFFTWVKFEFGGFNFGSVNAFEFFFTGTLPWLLIVAVGVISFLTAAGTLKVSSSSLPMIMLIASALGTLLVLIRLVFNPLDGASDEGISRGIGLYLSTVAAIASVAGSFIAFTESGGNLKDLTDIDKLKGSFGSGGATPPPPPGA